jgi:D-lactate dehydrogenase
MKVSIFSTKPYDRRFFEAANTGHALEFHDFRLEPDTASAADGTQAVCPFINDDLSTATLEKLHALGIKLVVLRSAGFNIVNLETAARLGMTVLRVPSYSPYAVAEHALALLMTLNRKTHRAYNRVREGNFSLDGLLGFDVNEKTVGIIGTGTIGVVFARILSGMGCRLLGFDPFPSDAFREFGKYVLLDDLYAASDIISLHCPLTPESHRLINKESLKKTKSGLVLINTSRGALVDTEAVIDALKSGHISALGLDVYEKEEEVFFEDLSDTIIQDDVLQLLLSFPNVIVTSHQAFFTDTALNNIAQTTMRNLDDFAAGRASPNEVRFTK